MLSPKRTRLLVVLILEQFNCLAKVAVYILDLALTLPVINSHVDLDCFVRVVQNFVNLGWDLHVVLGRKATKAALVLDAALKIKILRGQALYRLLFYPPLLFFSHDTGSFLF